MQQKKDVEYIASDRSYVFECPHCNAPIQVGHDQLNCHIFRHGVIKSTMIQMDPHLPKAECDRLYESGAIYGCGRPFQLVKEGDDLKAMACDYI